MSIKAKTIKERLEGSYRLIRIKRIKFGFFLLQIVLGVVMGSVIAFLIGASFDPFFFPFDVFLFILFLMLLFVGIEAIYFKGVEIRYTRSKSRRYLIARNSIRRSAVILAISILCLIFMLLPLTQEMMTDLYQKDGSGSIGIGDFTTFNITSQGPIGFTRADTLTFSITTGEVELAMLNENNDPMWAQTTIRAVNTIEMPAGFNPSFQETYEVYLANLSPVAATYAWSLDSSLSTFLILYFPILAIAFIVVEMISISIMYPLRETYASMSIYSKKYVAEKETGSYVAPVKTREEEKEDALLESTLDIEIPPPPPEPAKPAAKAAPPPPPVKKKVEVAKKMGEVDADLIEEEDVPCPTCGEMNSPHAAMCFVCGNPMAVMEEKVPEDVATVFMKAVELSNTGQHQQAIKLFDDVLESDKANEDALLGKGTALHQQGKWGSAIQYINTALQVNPYNVDALLQKAQILTERDKPDKAIEIYEEVLKIDPGNATAKAKIDELSEEIEMEDAEDVLDQFMCVPGIGLIRATALYEAGYTNFAKLASASEADLAKVNGISERLAKKIKKGLETML